MTNLQERVQAENKLKTYINKVVPLLLERFKTEVKYKISGEPIKKHKADFDAILADAPSPINARIEWGDYSISVKIRTNYPHPVSGNIFIEDYYYLYAHPENKIFDFEPLDMITEDTIKTARIELERLLILQREISSQISIQKRILNK